MSKNLTVPLALYLFPAQVREMAVRLVTELRREGLYQYYSGWKCV
jgi:hypothetical protein